MKSLQKSKNIGKAECMEYGSVNDMYKCKTSRLLKQQDLSKENLNNGISQKLPNMSVKVMKAAY